ncbi:ZIP family metal transporter [Sphingomonas bacterium]|uniref:ZIP family metal transporter n=1 Tax=Sphingomonas bacterium TaxID=1895847 RepID=UPI00157638A7|nr:ZIP family metal transporter [Sphingomonas bacterium]
MTVSTPLMLGVAASTATLLGGGAALRWRRHLVLLLGITAGIVLGVALFDLLPEAIELAQGTVGERWLSGAVAVGLGAYMLLDRGRGGDGAVAATGWRAHLGPGTLTLHSLVDGLGIGLAFQASTQVGWVVAAAVLSHDVVDGVNTVSLSLASRTERAARGWLLANGAAPLIGVSLGLVLPVSPGALALILGGFGGAFLHIGTGELLPRSYRLDPRPRTSLASLAGMALVAGINGLIR